MPTVLPNDVMCLVPTLAAFGRLCIASLLACLLMSPAFAAGPSGGTVSAGSATITQSAAQTTIKQTSNKAVVNWSNFSIGSGSSVRFVQPSASSIALNRVTGSQASVIQGALQANGQVWVLNPNGVLIAPGGQVAAGSFLATTRSLTDQQFMAGNYAFTDGGVAGASVVNQGSIIVAEGGYAVLAGEAVRNDGYIEANLGQVVLGGAKTFTLDITGDNTLAFVVTAPVDVSPTDGKAVVDNAGSIQAAGGRVLMTARAASQVVGQVINTGGAVVATSAQMLNGKIVLDGGSGSVNVAGNLDASGKASGQTGGSIDVNAQKIQVKATAKLDVSGDAGGGKIAIGAGGPNTRTQSFTPAESTTIAAGARLEASALTRGDGGEILVFTSLTNPLAFTQVAGSLSARGGAQGGNGGFVETSGYRLDVSGIVVSTIAPKGRLGIWLLDPTIIVIGTEKTEGEEVCNRFGGLSNCSSILNTDLSDRLNTTNVRLDATNSILVNALVSWTGPGALTLNTSSATGFIQVNSAVTSTSPSANLNLTSTSITVSAAVNVAGRFLATGTGSSTVTVAGGGSIAASGVVSIDAQTVNISGPISSTDDTGGVSVSISNATTVNLNRALSGNTILVAAPDGTINVASDFISAGTTLTAANVTVSATGTAGPLNVRATSTITLDADYAPGAAILAAPTVNWNAGWFGSNIELQANTVNWGAGGAYTMGAGTVLTVGAPAVPGTTTFNLAGDLTLQATRLNINNPLAWSTHQLKLNANQDPTEGLTQGVAINAAVSGTRGAKLIIATGFVETGGSQTLRLSGTPANQSTFTLGGGVPQTDGTALYSAAPNVKTVVIDNGGGGGGSGGGSSGGSGSSDTPVIIVTPAATTTSTTAAAAAAKAAADAAAAKAAADAAAAQAVADAAAAKAAALDTTTKVVVEQAIAQAVATVVASTSATVFVAPPPPPPTSTATSGTTATTATVTASSNTAATTASTTTTVTTATTAASSTAQGTTVTQEFVEPLSVTTLSSTTSTVTDPGDTSAATTSTNTGPASQTAAPASTATAAPAAPALTPVAVSKDGADAGDFTLQTVKPPAPVTAAKQEARPTERVTTTPVSPGIALQASQKTPTPSGSVLGREISGSGNSSNW